MNKKQAVASYRNVFSALFPVAVLSAAVAISAMMMKGRGSVDRHVDPRAAPLVETTTLSPTIYQTKLSGYGNVEASRRVVVRPEVDGVVIEQNEKLVVGGRIAKGELLVRVDPRDYAAALVTAKAELAQADLGIQLERGRQLVARREWELLGEDGGMDKVNSDLALRLPHMQQKKAALAAAMSRVEKAMADLERTTIFAPFDGQVLSESVEKGQWVSSQTVVAELVAIDRFRVLVALPVDRLSRVRIQTSPGDAAPRALITSDAGNGEKAHYEGRLTHLLPDLEPNGRLARLYVEVEDPLGLAGSDPEIPLLLGSYVRVEIQGDVVEDTYLIPWVALRNGSRIWTVDSDGELAIRNVEIIERTQEWVVIRHGVEPGMVLITSALPFAVPGMKVQISQSGQSGVNDKTVHP